MKADKKKKETQPPKSTDASAHEAMAHSSQGHTPKEPGHQEPIARASTTDSSRAHKNPHDDIPDGGNIR